jgi:hypothetical protein
MLFDKLGLVGLHEIRWEGGGTKPAGEYTFCYRKGNENYEVQRVNIVSDRMLHIILMCNWCHNIVLNVHAPTEGNTDNVKDKFYEKLEHLFDKFPKYHIEMLLGDFNAKVGRKDTFILTVGNESLH